MKGATSKLPCLYTWYAACTYAPFIDFGAANAVTLGSASLAATVAAVILSASPSVPAAYRACKSRPAIRYWAWTSHMVKRAATPCSAGVGAADPRGRIVELARVEIRGDTDVVPNAFADDTVNARSQLPPGRGDDAGFDLVAHDPIVGRRFVGLVQDAKGD